MANFSKPQSIVTMLVALFALLQLTVASQHAAHHHHEHRRHAEIKAHLDRAAEALQKRQGGGIGPYIATSGVCSTGTQWWGDCNPKGRQSYPRLEIRQLKNNADQWNLYLLGMERFMAKDKGDTLSFYQIAGLHGRPFTTWNKFPTPLLNQAGFCPHGTTIFGSWHRPYLAMYEQAWYLAVTEVINGFPSNQQQRWRNAASTLRMPYWDWAQDPGNGQPTVPTTIRDPQVTVTKPQGQVQIANPLYSYTWGKSLPNEMGGGPWNSWPTTLRRPVANPTRSNNNEVNARMNSIRISLRDRIFALFASKQSWGNASTSQIGVRTDLSGSGVDSFESVHDVVHNTAGGETGGHMYYLDVSAFDPIFWLHHTNIDRLLTMYQYIVPNTWVANGNIRGPMAQWNAGESKNGGSPLKPFTKNTYGDYFTSDDVRDTRVLGYYYPETSNRSYSQVAQAVTSLYGGGARKLTKRDGESNYNSVGQYLGRPLKEGDYHHVLDITADKFAMAGSYTVHCFIGNPGNSTSNSTSNSTAPYGNSTSSAYLPTATSPSKKNGTGEILDDYDPALDFTNDPNYVGAYGILGGMKAGNASSPLITRGSLPLTTCLQGKQVHGYLASLHPHDVEPYLHQNMYYKVISDAGEIDPSTIPNFHVAVKCNKVQPAASDDDLPDLSAPFQVLHKATAKLPAGKPYTHTPVPNEMPAPNADYSEDGYNAGYPDNDNGGNYQSPSNSNGEGGFCPVVQTIKYVYPDGRPAGS
ncbi:common central domain of tyrosinase-domain-containing protein [Ampelomyces quisqualis]|uniref:tyrosinase n=1 Tax=Ampelomyces quisqualis TaxID=50730 RepID=A0A6A5R0I7_AMPQU|nr:common central domain of tyrosinase-domain-containing protein [Ampelomyces quisqualis]